MPFPVLGCFWKTTLEEQEPRPLGPGGHVDLCKAQSPLAVVQLTLRWHPPPQSSYWTLRWRRWLICCVDNTIRRGEKGRTVRRTSCAIVGVHDGVQRAGNN